MGVREERTTGGPVGEASGSPVTSSTQSGATDLDLLHAHVAGDRDAFAELFHRHRDRLWAVALRTLGEREEAADALQDALLSAHRAAGRFRGDSAVTTWLHRIVVNACLDRIRRRQAHPTVPLPDGARDDSGAATGGVEPAAPVEDHDTALVVRQALAGLPAEQRAALILVDVQGYPVAEVAQILGVAEGTVKSRCARGRARLAAQLGHLRPGPVTRQAERQVVTPGSKSAPTTGPDVPAVTRGNPRSPEGVRSVSGRSRRDAHQEDA
ncbi:RNA polymerase sigma factor SigM [Micromonospora sp. NPDC047074]|uniref:RNA polymerase sigma factor SigM n=1 Tax=Micromonospora sp. NPDC047074 TaxID=3154339 RepID=UPI0033CB2079